MNKTLKEILEWVYCILIALVLAILIKNFLGTPTTVRQYSMDPTLKQGEKLILNRVSKTFKKMPERGDIITFEQPSKIRYEIDEVDLEKPIALYENEPNNIFSMFIYNALEIGKKSYIKRVIGLPGEHVEIKDGVVYINGEKLEEPYLNSTVMTEAGLFNDFTVPENTVFAMGDNRSVSLDCRAFGCVPLDKIESKVWIRIWPFNKFGKVE